MSRPEPYATAGEPRELPIVYPDTHDRRQSERDGAGWPRHRARRRNRRRRQVAR